MNLQEIRATLEAALPVQVPRFDPEGGPQAKVRALEDYLLDTARYRADLERALHWSLEAGKALRGEWDGIEGYEVALPRGSNHTKEQVNAAKRTVRSDLWSGMEECRALADSLGRQIRRLELDYQTVSRAYTLMSGS